MLPVGFIVDHFTLSQTNSKSDSIVSQLAHHIDLNTLHALSQTCRQVGANLLQYRRQLVRQTLRCSNEYFNDCLCSKTKTPDATWHILGGSNMLTSGKVSTCARDMVSDCRSCGRIICRVTLPSCDLSRIPPYTLTTSLIELHPQVPLALRPS